MAASEGATDRANTARDRVLERRRRFLTGGLTAVPVVITTLANRPALGANVCTVSAQMSGNLSRPITGACGSSPGCWRNHALSNNASSWKLTKLSPYDPFTGLFPIFKTLPWKAVATDATLVQALDPSLKNPVVNVQISGNWVASGFPAAFPAQIVAAVLNARFYGITYPLGENEITLEVLSALAFTPPMTDNKLKDIKTRVSNLTNRLGGYNNVETICPVV